TTYNDDRDARSDATPTNETPRPLQLSTSLEYSPVEPMHLDDSPEAFTRYHPPPQQHQQRQPDEYGMQATYTPGGNAFEDFRLHDDDEEDLPQQRQASSSAATYLDYRSVSPNLNMHAPGAGAGGLGVVNHNRAVSEEWPQEALRHMNLGR
ncbi:hypothetical protein LTR33_015814, partial [Friedmanniomyces endolithicus]